MVSKNDFWLWMGTHDAAFPGFQRWFGTEDETKLEERERLWLQRLESVSLSELIGGTERLFAAPDKPPFGGHLDKLLAMIRPPRQLNEAVKGPACRLCNASGILTVEHMDGQAMTPAGNPLPDNTGPVLCKCALGQWMHERQMAAGGADRFPMQVYDSTKHVLVRIQRLNDAERAGMLERLARGPGGRGLAGALGKVLVSLRKAGLQ